MSVKLKQFDPAAIGHNRICVFIGKRGTGKTTLLKDILYHARDIPRGVAMSATEESNEVFGEIMPKKYIFPEYRDDIVGTIVSQQRQMKKQCGSTKPVFLVLEDCLYDRELKKSKNIRSVFFNGRHWKMLLLLTMQYCMDIGPELRGNVDYVFVLKDNIIANRERLHRNFFGMIPRFDTFQHLMNQCTENYECLVLDNTSTSNKLEDCVYWYKARQHRPFSVGNAEYRNCKGYRAAAPSSTPPELMVDKEGHEEKGRNKKKKKKKKSKK
jgi:hypothetical protein